MPLWTSSKFGIVLQILNSTWMSEPIIQFDCLSFKALLFENYTGLKSEKMNKNFILKMYMKNHLMVNE